MFVMAVMAAVDMEKVKVFEYVTVTIVTEVRIKFLHWTKGALESAVEVFGWILVLVREALPDHPRRVQILAVCHEGIQFMTVPAEHREVRFSEESEKLEFRG
jgi:hypothetical protein